MSKQIISAALVLILVASLALYTFKNNAETTYYNVKDYGVIDAEKVFDNYDAKGIVLKETEKVAIKNLIKELNIARIPIIACYPIVGENKKGKVSFIDIVNINSE